MDFFAKMIGVIISVSVNALIVMSFTGPILIHFGLPPFPLTWEMFVALFAIFLLF